MGQTITLATAGGRAFDSYLATPAAGAGPGVVVVSTIFGVEPDVVEVADRLAAEGCVAAIPNMFWRDERDSGVLVSPTDYGRAIARSERIDLDQSMSDLATVVADLKRRPQCNGRIALMGFCFGGPYALLGAGGLGIEVALSYHGSHVGKYLDAVDKVRCPLSFHYGDRDHVAPMSEIEEIRKAFARLPDAEVHVYPGGGHGYMLRHRKDYLPHAAEASWKRTLELLRPLRIKGAQAAE
jgi:carboxymethylenebutenolidase